MGEGVLTARAVQGEKRLLNMSNLCRKEPPSPSRICFLTYAYILKNKLKNKNCAFWGQNFVTLHVLSEDDTNSCHTNSYLIIASTFSSRAGLAMFIFVYHLPLWTIKQDCKRREICVQAVHILFYLKILRCPFACFLSTAISCHHAGRVWALFQPGSHERIHTVQLRALSKTWLAMCWKKKKISLFSGDVISWVEMRVLTKHLSPVPWGNQQ